MSLRVPVSRDERGFVLILVLFVMAALTVTVSGALLITQSDQQTARASVDANRAFHAAQAGLMYFVTDRSALRNDSTVYTISGGRVVVRSRRVAVYGLEEVHEISSRATVQSGGTQSEVREVRQLAAMELRPINPVAGFATTARNVTVQGTISGNDVSVNGACTAAARGNVAGAEAVSGGTFNIPTTSLSGNPRSVLNPDTATARARVSAEWEELLDPRMTYQYEFPAAAWPNFAALAPTAYPTIRVRGAFTANALRSGRGLLIVDGTLTLGADFVWDGLIVAGQLASTTATSAQIRGALISGMSTAASGTVVLNAISSTAYLRITYDACKVYQAEQGAVRMRLLPNTWWEPV